MKRIFFISSLIFFFTLNNSKIVAQETITNKKVIEMKKLGFNSGTIIEKIKTSDVKFDTSIHELSKLKKAGISTAIISLILRKSKHNSKSKTGIYFTDKSGKQKLIQPTVFSGTNSNSVAQKLVSGLINSKKRAQLPRTKSNNVIKSSRPEFTFIFDPSTTEANNLQNGQGQGNSIFIPNWWFRVSSNPNEFVLVKLTVKERKNLREVIIGKKSWISSSKGIDTKNALSFSIKELESNKFKVIPDRLEPGEYCFIYQGQVPQGRTNQSVFDFSIQ